MNDKQRQDIYNSIFEFRLAQKSSRLDFLQTAQDMLDAVKKDLESTITGLNEGHLAQETHIQSQDAVDAINRIQDHFAEYPDDLDYVNIIIEELERFT